MKLKYRGVEYNHTPIATETTGLEVIGKYRGAICRRSRLASLPVPQPIFNLKYRGCRYTTGVAGQQQTPTASQPAAVSATVSTIPSFDETLSTAVTSTAQMGVRKLLEVNEVHQRFIRENLQHRLEVAKQHGDQALIDLLEQERRQVA